MEPRDIDKANARLAYTIIEILLDGHDALSELLVKMSHALDEDTLKALTNSTEWENYLASKRALVSIDEQVLRFRQALEALETGE